MRRILLLFILLLSFGKVVNAEEVEDDWLSTTTFVECEKDDLGHVTSGTYKYDVQEFSNNWYHCGYGFPSNSSGLYFVRVIDVNATFSKISYILYTIDGSNINGRLYNCDSSVPIDTNTVEFNWNNFNKSVTGIISYDSGGFITDIPVFDQSDENYEDNVSNYVENGDTSGAVNNDDMSSEPEYSDQIELPLNLKLASGYDYNLLARSNLLFPEKDIVLTWEQSVDTSSYEYELEIRYKLDHVTHTSLLGKEDLQNYTSDYYSIGKFDYNGMQNITCKIEHNTLYDHLLDISNKNGWTGSKSYLRNVFVRVRNISGESCSNYVTVSLDFPNGSATKSETDSNGNVVENPQYDNDDAINDDYTNKIDKLTDYSEFIKWIKSGMGLGESGLLGFIKHFYNTCIPFGEPFWGLIMMGFATMILIGIVNFLLKR